MSEEQVKFFESNPERYHRLSQPFSDRGEAIANIERFYTEVGKLREECKLPDVLIVVGCSLTTASGEPGEILNLMNYGSALRAEALAAYAFGAARRDREEMIAELLAGKRKK